jgi:uncharacterized membrane protein
MNGKQKNEISLFLSALGFWLLAAPSTFGYKSAHMHMNDHICGALLVILGFLGVLLKRKFVYWIAIFIGLWLQLAPLFFWAPEAASYLNDTFVGMIVIVLSFLLPGMTGLDSEEGADNPPGWSFNPSAWPPRICTVFLAMVCWFLARYLSAFQLGYIDHIWDPFFGGETVKVLTSDVARFFPVSDAGLGAFGYSLEFLLGWLGNSKRWRTMPWMVVAFGLMVVPAGIVSITLIVLQPVIVGAWCGLCLVIAGCMLTMIVLTIPEVVAVFQFLSSERKSKKSLWHAFWFGDLMPQNKIEAKPIARTSSQAWGFTLPWNLVLTAAIGVWLMFSPHMLGIQSPASDSDYIAGPLLITFSVIAFSEATRSLRYVNMIIGLWLIFSPWLLSGANADMVWNNSILGIAAIVLSLRKGTIRERYGAWDEHIK